jgi:small-conductance mechanosensitive channel
LILHTTVTIGYDVPWQRVHDLLVTAASNLPLVEKAPAPFVHQTSLADFSVAYELNVYTREPEKMAAIYSDLFAHIQDAFNHAGIEILSPAYSAIPEGHLAKDYQAPPFKIQPLEGIVHRGKTED